MEISPCSKIIKMYCHIDSLLWSYVRRATDVFHLSLDVYDGERDQKCICCVNKLPKELLQNSQCGLCNVIWWGQNLWTFRLAESGATLLSHECVVVGPTSYLCQTRGLAPPPTLIPATCHFPSVFALRRSSQQPVSWRHPLQVCTNIYDHRCWWKSKEEFCQFACGGGECTNLAVAFAPSQNDRVQGEESQNVAWDLSFLYWLSLQWYKLLFVETVSKTSLFTEVPAPMEKKKRKQCSNVPKLTSGQK